MTKSYVVHTVGTYPNRVLTRKIINPEEIREKLYDASKIAIRDLNRKKLEFKMLNQFLFFKVKILDGCNTLYPPCILLKKSSKTTRAKKPRLIALMDYCGKYFDPTSQCLKFSQKVSFYVIASEDYERLLKTFKYYRRL